MKRFLNYVYGILLLGAMTISLSACGGDDDSDTPSSPKTIEPVSEKLKPFIGSWSIEHDGSNTQTNPGHNIIFFQDGKCFVQTRWKQGGNDGLHSEKDGLSWDYDEATKILAVAGVSTAQWTITSIDDNAWSGVGMGSLSNVSYTANRRYSKREQILDEYFYPYVKTWECDTVKAEFSIISGSSSYYAVTFNKYYTTLLDEGTREVVYPFTCPVTGSTIKVTRDIYYDEADDKIVVNYIEDRKNYTHILLEFVHPYSYKDVYMNVVLEFQSQYKDKLAPVKWSGKFLPKRN